MHSAHFQWGILYPSLGKRLSVGSAVTIASSLMGGCGLSHKRVEDGCKSTCVKVWGLKTRQNYASLIHVLARSDLHKKK